MAGGAYFPLEPTRTAKKPAKKKEAEKPAEQPEKKPLRVVVIASSDSPTEVKAFLNRTTITGVVKASAFETWDTKKELGDWEVEGQPTEKVWFVWADDKPPKMNLQRTETISYGLGIGALVCLALGALAFTRGGEGRRER